MSLIFSMSLIKKWCEQRDCPVEKVGTKFQVSSGVLKTVPMERPKFRRYMTIWINKITAKYLEATL